MLPFQKEADLDNHIESAKVMLHTPFLNMKRARWQGRLNTAEQLTPSPAGIGAVLAP